MFGLSIIHHAYFIENGDFEFVAKELRTIDFECKGNPDFWHLETESLSIDDARNIKNLQAQKPIAGDRRIFVIETFAMTVEAQNALLKVFEEPTADAIFIIIAPRANILLPTLRSRMVVISLKGNLSLSPIDVKKFIGSAPAKRIEMLKPILETKDAEGNKKADKKAAAAFLSALREEIGAESAKGGFGTLSAIDEALIYLFDRSSSVKLLLETVAISIPEKMLK